MSSKPLQRGSTFAQMVEDASSLGKCHNYDAGTLTRGRNEVEEDKRMSLEKQAAVHVPAGEGEAVWLLGDTYTLKISGEQTGGAFTLLEAVVPLGGRPPPHIHQLEDEVFVILEGELLVTVAGRTLPAPVGTIISVPKGTQHSYAVVGTAPVRMLFLYVPAGTEKMFDEIGKPAQLGVAAPPASEEDVAKLLSVAAKYNFTIVPPEGDNPLYPPNVLEVAFCEVRFEGFSEGYPALLTIHENSSICGMRAEVRRATVSPYAKGRDVGEYMGADVGGGGAVGGSPAGALVEGGEIRVVRPGSEDSETPQGLLGVGAVSRETVGAGGIFMARHRVPPGAHSDLHSHANCETAVYVLCGRGYAYGGEDMGEYVEAGPGDFVYIPANLAHVVGCPAGEEALEYVVARDAPGEVVVTLRAAEDLPIGPDVRMRGL